MDNKLKDINNIIWDWNGTLLDDLNLCVDSINLLLDERGIEKLSVEKYQKIFCFPVKDYYLKAGFNFEKEDFKIPATQFIDLYNSQKNLCKLSFGAYETIKAFHEQGMRQFILSASETYTLKEMLINHNLTLFFEDVYGLDNHYANGKKDLAAQMSSNLNLRADQTLLIGDTCHDAEVAIYSGWKSVLYSGGHYPKDRLLSCSTSIIVDRLSDITDLLNT